MSIHDQDLLTPVSRHLRYCFLQQLQLQLQAIGDRSGLVPRLEDLPKVIRRKNDGILLPGRLLTYIAHINQVGTQRQLRTMLLDNPKRQHARALCLLHRLDEIRPRQFFPFCR